MTTASTIIIKIFITESDNGREDEKTLIFLPSFTYIFYYPASNYSLHNTNLKKSSCERDLGIIVDRDSCWTKHIAKIAKKAEGVLASLIKSFVSRSPTIYLRLYIAMVRSHLEFASPVWNPFLAQDINRLEAVQRCATKRITSIRNLPYSERLTSLGMDTLKLRRLAADLADTHKIINHLTNNNSEHLFKLHPSNTRGHI
ncbi:RNA-directed DNA polymerase from mobile element jockey-like [Octopus vulgaris]|uniref:RNA-directed DNA polymerase from mobile element jockey-like n=1 Tax=Octopus vulgaris TaxID=6645 RepID=A0AA36HHE1_OCTVU|nr:RNA-directed DNA polymerase from mobile element jockey-like [Octopus vulgaris]